MYGDVFTAACYLQLPTTSSKQGKSAALLPTIKHMATTAACNRKSPAADDAEEYTNILLLV